MSAADLPTGPKHPSSTVLSLEAAAAVVVAVRRHMLLPVGRLSTRVAAHVSASDAIILASLPAAPRDRPLAGCQRQQTGNEEGQGPPDRLLPHRHCRSEDRIGKLRMFVAIDRTRSSPSLTCMRRQPLPFRPTSYATFSKPLPNRSTPCLPTTAFSSPRPEAAAAITYDGPAPAGFEANEN